jgi:two-component system phosphate regulon response regulator PhoB
VSARVLIIEDDNMMMNSTAMVLVETGGCDVVTASGGREGIETALREQPELILLDIMMPEMDGWEVLRELKADPHTAGIPVLIFTAYEVDPSQKQTLRDDANGIVRKPFEPSELVDIVNRTAGQRIPD